jgi:predicted phage tail protein
MTLESSSFENTLDNAAIVGASFKAPYTPKEDPDTLRSKASASFLAVFAEGEIEGFFELDAQGKIKRGPDGKISKLNPGAAYFADDTPLSKIPGAIVLFNDGTQTQSSLPGFDDIRIEQSVGQQVKSSIGPILATTTSSLLNQITVRVGVSSLFEVTKKGDTIGGFVFFGVRITDSTGGQVSYDVLAITGKTRGAYDQEHTFGLSGTGPWTVAVSRITPDSTTARLNNDFFFRAIVGIVNQTLRYPNTAMAGITISAENFQTVPAISAQLLGLKIQVPDNYNSASNSYSGLWGGQFKVEYNNNPVWVFYDLLTNKRYGAGLFIEKEDIDIYGLLPIAKYCDEMVPNGSGGTEKRFTFNGYINNRAEAFEVLNSLAAAFRGMLYYANGQIIATQDKIKPVTQLFSPSNVINEVDDSGTVTSPPFAYEGTARKARKTVALVSWNDPADRYKAKIEYCEDRDGIERYGYREVDIRAFGCTSQGQAQRLGKWTLLSDLYETETVTFKIGAQGFFVSPGEIIEVADPSRNTGIAAGIAPSFTSNTITLGRPVVLSPNISYQIILSDGTGNTIERSVTNAAGEYSVLSVAPSLPSPPALVAPTAWILRASTANPRFYRVTALSEDNGIVSILAVSYYAEKFAIADSFARTDKERTSVPQSSIVPAVSASSIQLQAR